MDSDRQLDSESPAPSFSKLILHETLETGKLVIPEQFIRKYAKDLQENQKVHLRVPPDTTWEVRLKKQENDLFLHKVSWSRFMKFYNIKFAHLLVFSYKGDSMLDVVIFDETASEIKYPYQCNGNTENAIPKVEGLDDVVVIEDNDDENKEENNLRERSRVNEGRSQTSGDSRNDAVHRRLHRASPITLHSLNPYFEVAIGATYLSTTYGLHVPTKFARRYIGVEDCLVKFYDYCGRCWDVQFSFREFSHQVKTKITSGWIKFARDNDLRIGDVCTFHLVKRNVPLHFRVAISKAGERQNHSAFPDLDFGECSSRRISQQLLMHFNSRNSGNPSFSLMMTEHYLRRWNVPIKTGFLKHLKKKEQMVTLGVANREWMVKAIRYPNRKGLLSFGWYKFQEDNSLQVGDTCVFELIEKQNMVFKVFIQRAQARREGIRI